MRLITLLIVLGCLGFAADGFALSEKGVENGDVVALTRFLEKDPFNKDAPLVRTALLRWEEKSKDVIDLVCPGLLSPIPNKSIPYSGELAAQHIFGSAALQIEDPSKKGNVIAGQVAGIKSMLKAYRSMTAQKPSARIPKIEEFAQHESDGTLEAFMEPLVAKECKTPH
ncbi:MAG: hypothetical protein J0I77_04430 [Rudaea sp.]|uniref:hypothetical protein n=1 Tax=unclassified Rudaea TaxID=2627037 RepID=UPI0010F928FD|nr:MULTISPECIES: hypothetical protein [unclassified Rudaea]MBN8884940.1 hypothetical protein [Rudaea sp.]MBR0344483.1 hypothetical protein [Rudaea sp.]